MTQLQKLMEIVQFEGWLRKNKIKNPFGLALHSEKKVTLSFGNSQLHFLDFLITSPGLTESQTPSSSCTLDACVSSF